MLKFKVNIFHSYSLLEAERYHCNNRNIILWFDLALVNEKKKSSRLSILPYPMIIRDLIRSKGTK